MRLKKKRGIDAEEKEGRANSSIKDNVDKAASGTECCYVAYVTMKIIHLKKSEKIRDITNLTW